MMAERITQLTGWRDNSKFGKLHPADSSADLEVVVSDIMHQIGVPAHIKGYQYLREAIILSINDSEMMNSVTKVLYPTVAKTFQQLLQELNVPYATQLKLHGIEATLTFLVLTSAIQYKTLAESPLTLSLLP